MANDEHVALLKQGPVAWNTWRNETPDIRPDLSYADLRGANLVGADLGRADLRGARLAGADLGKANLRDVDLSGAYLLGTDLRRADLTEARLSGADLRVADLRGAVLMGTNLSVADLREANLSGANLSAANLSEANLSEANLSTAVLSNTDLSNANLSNTNLKGADLRGIRSNAEHGIIPAKLSVIRINANLSHANLSGVNLSSANLSGSNLSNANLSPADLSAANLSGANLSAANLQAATLLETDLTGADLNGCRIYGVSTWGLKLERSKQQNLIITQENEPTVTVDNIEVAQFIYLMLNNQKVRDVIDTITSKAVLILGRFTDERKAVLDALREELRKRDYLPILFDFDVPATRDITETVSLLARMARFIVADLTDPSSIPKELEAIVPDLAVPVQPLLEGSSRPYAMFKDYWKYDWVLPVYRYEGLEPLLATLAEKVIAPAEGKVKALQERRRVIEAELTKPQ
jgi:uncharacterized protein YjbI with pentapeptide repeats